MGTEIPVQIRGRRPIFLVDAIIRIRIKADIAREVAVKVGIL